MTIQPSPQVPGTGAASPKGGWQGARIGPLLLTALVGLVLYFGLPAVVPVPDAKAFTGQPAAPKPAAPAPPKAAPPATRPAPVTVTAPVEKPRKLSRAEAEAKVKAEAEAKAWAESQATQKAEAEAKAKAEADAKVKAAAEEKRRSDWTKGLHLFAIFVTTILGIILKPLPMGAVFP